MAVVTIALAVGGAGTLVRDWQAGLVLGTAALMLAALATVPKNLGEGEYDLLGCSTILALPIVWLVLWAGELLG